MEAKAIGWLLESDNVPVSCAFAKAETSKAIIKTIAVLVIKFIWSMVEVQINKAFVHESVNDHYLLLRRYKCNKVA